MTMGHTPYGYRIENGKAVVNEVEAEKIRALYSAYLSGAALKNAATAAGLDIPHGSVKRLLQNAHYTGDDFYPAIIDRETFDETEAELIRRATALKRNERKCKERPVRTAPTKFYIKKPETNYTDPVLQAQYLYSLIETEAI